MAQSAARISPPKRAAISTASSGGTSKRQTESMRQTPLNAGLSGAEGWHLTSAVSESSNGTAIVGYGQNPSLRFEAFRVVVSVLR